MMRLVLLLISLTFAAPALAHPGPPPTLAVLQQREAKRFPQPVRVGDLIGQRVLEPSESQGVLGRVEAITKRPDGGLDLVMSFGGILGLGARSIAVPIEAMAVLGPQVVAVDYSKKQLGALPTATETAALGPNEIIRVGIVRPYH